MNEEILRKVISLKSENETIIIWNGIPYEYVSLIIS